jgi:hypothetical protein
MFTTRKAVRGCVALVVSVLATTLYSCNACSKPKPTGVAAKLILEGVTSSDCNFAAMAASGKQTIEVYVRAKYGSGPNATTFARHYNFTNVPNLTYDVEVPSIGPFEISLSVIEVDSQTCQRCATVMCTSGHAAVPAWSELVRYQNGGVDGVTYNIPIDKCGVQCCGCR